MKNVQKIPRIALVGDQYLEVLRPLVFLKNFNSLTFNIQYMALIFMLIVQESIQFTRRASEKPISRSLEHLEHFF